MPIAKIQLPDGKIAKFEVSKGTTPEQVLEFANNQFKEQPQQQKVGRAAIANNIPTDFLQKVGEATLQFGPGLGDLFKGGVQKGAALMGEQDFARRLGEQVAQEREDLTTAQKVGRSVGQAIGLAPIGAGSGVIMGAAKGGAALSALSPITEGEVTPQEIAKQVALGTGTAAATAGALKGATAATSGVAKGVGKALSKVGQKLGLTEVDQPITASALKARASNLFKEAQDKGGVLNKKFTSKFVADATDTLSPKSKAGRFLDSDSVTSKVLDKIKALKKENLDLESIQDIDSFLGDKIQAETTIAGTLTDKGRKLLNLQAKLRNSLDKIDVKDVVGGKEGFKALKQAKKLWSRSLKLGDIERIIAKGDLSDNPATTIKTGFRALANNPKRLRGYSDQEKKLIREAAKSGIVTDALRTLGSRLLPIGTAVADGGVTGTLAAQVGATASRNLAAKGQVARGQKIVDEIVAEATGKLPVSRNINQRAKILSDLLSRTGGVAGTGLVNQ